MEEVTGRAKLHDTFDPLFWRRALNDGTWHVLLDDIMAQPEMRPFLACDSLEEISDASRDLYRTRSTGGTCRIEARHCQKHRVPNSLYAAITDKQVRKTLHGSLASWKRENQRWGRAIRSFRESDPPADGEVK